MPGTRRIDGPLDNGADEDESLPGSRAASQHDVAGRAAEELVSLPLLLRKDGCHASQVGVLRGDDDVDGAASLARDLKRQHLAEKAGECLHVLLGHTLEVAD